MTAEIATNDKVAGDAYYAITLEGKCQPKAELSSLLAKLQSIGKVTVTANKVSYKL